MNIRNLENLKHVVFKLQLAYYGDDQFVLTKDLFSDVTDKEDEQHEIMVYLKNLGAIDYKLVLGASYVPQEIEVLDTINHKSLPTLQ